MIYYYYILLSLYIVIYIYIINYVIYILLYYYQIIFKKIQLLAMAMVLTIMPFGRPVYQFYIEILSKFTSNTGTSILVKFCTFLD